MSNTTEFGGWPRPPRWVWAIAAVATVAVWRPGDARLYVAITRPPAGTWPIAGPGPY